MMKKPAEVKKTFNHIPSVRVPAFAEARSFIEKICTGHINPERVKALRDKAVALMNTKGKSRPARHLTMTGSAVVRRRSGLLVPPKYKD